MFPYFLLFSHLILYVQHTDTVRIIGLFPDEEASRATETSGIYSHWTNQCVAMFRTAMKLAEKYNLTYQGKPIDFTIDRATSPNGFKEFDRTCNIITNSSDRDVVGIVGPSSSTAARFLAMLATHINMPLISHAATNNDLSDPEMYPTFFRIAPSDRLLARAIAQLFNLFSWTTCTLIIGNDDYGYGGWKVLSEEYHSNITLRERIVFDPERDKFHVNLSQTIGRSWTRIVLVWANQSSCVRIIQHALDTNLLGGQYIWILTGEVNRDSL